jgi:hypothetical protein
MRTGRVIRQWQDEFGPFPPYRLDAGALFVSFMSSAEYGCHIALGWGSLLAASIRMSNSVITRMTVVSRAVIVRKVSTALTGHCGISAKMASTPRIRPRCAIGS